MLFVPNKVCVVFTRECLVHLVRVSVDNDEFQFTNSMMNSVSYTRTGTGVPLFDCRFDRRLKEDYYAE